MTECNHRFKLTGYRTNKNALVSNDRAHKFNAIYVCLRCMENRLIGVDKLPANVPIVKQARTP